VAAVVRSPPRVIATGEVDDGDISALVEPSARAKCGLSRIKDGIV
jgi:hypothetical protein